MDLPPLSKEQLSKVLASDLPPSDLFNTLSEYEDEACLLFTDTDINGDPELLSVFYSSFFISHLLINEIPEARALTQRMPPSLTQQDPTLQNCLNLLRAVWQRKHEQVYEILRELPWPEPVKGLTRRYDAYFQDKTLREVSRAYEAIRPAVAAAYLGLDPVLAEQHDPAILQIFTNRGWRWDKESKLLYPKPIPNPPRTDAGLSNGLSAVTALIANHGS